MKVSLVQKNEKYLPIDEACISGVPLLYLEPRSHIPKSGVR